MDVVIGAAFGDEGKGLITHYLASRYGQEAIVVRFNGGAQAGHTVVTNDGRRHVFHHVSSGAFTGATTFLSRFFVSNPILFLEEITALKQLNVSPKVIIDPGSPITTPYDMAINQLVEESRGQQRHGSCGVGFAETIERSLQPNYALTVADLENTHKLKAKLHAIRQEWLPMRLRELKVTTIHQSWQEFMSSDAVFELFLHDLTKFSELITVKRLNLAMQSQAVIFEGAQGLMLDQERGWFPHVTRSNTGLKNVIELVQGNPKCHLNIFYVTRAYLTRHGAGPLPHELDKLPYKDVNDQTNREHPFQGALRYAWFNLPLIKSFIHTDINSVPTHIEKSHHVAVTCLDQVNDKIHYHHGNDLIQSPQASFLHKLKNEIQAVSLLGSYGQTMATLKEWPCD